MKKIFVATVLCINNKMQHLKILILASALFLHSAAECYGQEGFYVQEGLCKRKTEILFPALEVFNIQKPEDKKLLPQYEKLFTLNRAIQEDFAGNYLSFQIIPVAHELKDKNFLKSQQKYILYGFIRYTSADEYQLQLFLKTTCSEKILAQSEVLFQLYPTWNPDRIATHAVSKLTSLININKFELNERESKNYGLGGDLWGGRITITMDKAVVKGEETRIVMRVMDCDNRELNNKEISTEGTIGGIFTPAKFSTDARGNAITKFKMTSDKTAIIKASCETKNVWGCQDLYTGSEAIKGIEGFPVKVSINYKQEETKTVKRATLPGVKIKGGEEAEMTDMQHRAVMYHFPSPASLKEGYLVAAMKDKPYPASKTEYVTERGYFNYTKNVKEAQISAMAGDIEVVKGEEKGEETVYYGEPSLQDPSEVFFFKGDVHNPPQFSWGVQYPASNNGTASGGIIIVKGDTGVIWTVNKITDPKSIYKTEYLLSLTLDAAEELKKGDKAMKKMFGFQLDDLTKVLDPTNPQKNMAGATGSQTIIVRILSPYPAD